MKLVIIAISLGTIVFYVIPFFWLRHILNEIFSYVITEKQFKKDKKEGTLWEKLIYKRYGFILPKWILYWYYAEISSMFLSLLIFPVCVIYEHNSILIFLWGLMLIFNAFTPMFFNCHRINRSTGNMYDYSRFIDRIEARKKLYPERYVEPDITEDDFES